MDFWTIVWALLFVFVGLPLALSVLYLIIYLVLAIHTHFQLKKVFKDRKDK